MRSSFIAVFLVLVGVLPIVADAATSGKQSDASIEALCRPYHHDACSEALGRWLPRQFDSLEWYGSATRVAATDAFAYDVHRSHQSILDAGSPDDGTAFVHGSAGGPPRGHAIYDPVHHIAFYHEGCCSIGVTIEASGMGPPPKRVVHRDLSRLQTRRGAKLGQTIAEVERIYGHARVWQIAGHPDETALSYSAPFNVPGAPDPHSGCTAHQSFLFRTDHMIAIELERGC